LASEVTTRISASKFGDILISLGALKNGPPTRERPKLHQASVGSWKRLLLVLLAGLVVLVALLATLLTTLLLLTGLLILPALLLSTLAALLAALVLLATLILLAALVLVAHMKFLTCWGLDVHKRPRRARRSTLLAFFFCALRSV
jgi:hypothetical protein